MSMECQNYKESIYLYAELEDDEKRALEKHILQCASCKQLLQEVQFTHEKTKFASAQLYAPRNSAALTHKIMSTIEPQVKETTGWMIPLERLLNLPSFRYALAAMSVVILLEFISEQASQKITDFNSQKPVASLQSVLNTSTFLKSIKTTRQWNDTEKRTSILHYLKTKKTYEQHE